MKLDVRHQISIEKNIPPLSRFFNPWKCCYRINLCRPNTVQKYSFL